MILGITNASERTYVIIIGHGQTVAAVVEVGENAHHNETWAMEQFTDHDLWALRYFELTGEVVNE